jgi:hypothetical protein
MFNLELILTIVSVIVIAISIWGIVYLAGKFITHFWIRSQLGDMPSAEEISKLYEENNAIIEYRKHSPIDKNSTL